jgi:hypothetical protein
MQRTYVCTQYSTFCILGCRGEETHSVLIVNMELKVCAIFLLRLHALSMSSALCFSMCSCWSSPSFIPVWGHVPPAPRVWASTKPLGSVYPRSVHKLDSQMTAHRLRRKMSYHRRCSSLLQFVISLTQPNRRTTSHCEMATETFTSIGVNSLESTWLMATFLRSMIASTSGRTPTWVSYHCQCTK